MFQAILQVFHAFLPTFMVAGLFLLLWAGWLFLAVPLLSRIAARAKMRWGEILVHAFRKPVATALLLLGALLTARSLSLFDSFLSTVFLGQLERVICLLCLSWGLLNARELVACIFANTTLSRHNSETLVRFFTRIYSALVIFFAIVMGMSEFGFDVSGIMTGLGLGSLTFALAAQDAASNFFGGLVIILERPFEIGDWISSDVIEGTVEDIAFRSTKIRTLAGSLTIVPNNKLSGSAVTNWTRLQHRLARFSLGLMYSTPKDTVAAVAEDIRTMLAAHDIIEGESIEVRLTEFSDSSIKLMVSFYTATTNIMDYRCVVEDVNYRILEIMAQNHASFAFPSQSIYFENAIPAPKKGDL